MKQAHDYRKYNVRLTSADWQRGSCRVINVNIYAENGRLLGTHITHEVNGTEQNKTKNESTSGMFMQCHNINNVHVWWVRMISAYFIIS